MTAQQAHQNPHTSRVTDKPVAFISANFASSLLRTQLFLCSQRGWRCLLNQVRGVSTRRSQPRLEFQAEIFRLL
jgi:hypothetical protein